MHFQQGVRGFGIQAASIRAGPGCEIQTGTATLSNYGSFGEEVLGEGGMGRNKCI